MSRFLFWHIHNWGRWSDPEPMILTVLLLRYESTVMGQERRCLDCGEIQLRKC